MTNEDDRTASPEPRTAVPTGGCERCGGALVPWIEGTSEIGVRCSNCDYAWQDPYA